MDELKVMICTRFNSLRPLLELDEAVKLKLQFRTNNLQPYMDIETQVDLVSAFYTCNEIQRVTLHIKIQIDEETSTQLQILNKKRIERKVSSPKVSPNSKKRKKNIFGGGVYRKSPKAAMAEAEQLKEPSKYSLLKLHMAAEYNEAQQEERKSWGMPEVAQTDNKL